jgi:transposase-like protein
LSAALPELRPRFREGGFREKREEIGNDHPETRGRVLADGRRRRGRPTRFDPEIGNALIDLVINEDVPIKHAARRLGLGVRTVYDWLERAQVKGAAPKLVKCTDQFTQFLEWYRADVRRERFRHSSPIPTGFFIQLPIRPQVKCDCVAQK